jgi:sugar lactone lactonase YvrE
MNRFLTALVLAVAVTACSTPSTVPATGDIGGGESARGQAASKVNLFVANREDILEYTRAGRLVRTIPLGKYAPAGAIAFDKPGNLYAVSDYFAVSVFAPKSRALVRTITNGIFEPFALAVDSSNNLYVANGSNGYNGNIAVYPPGSATASRTITDGIYDPESLALDSSGNLYVGNGLYADRVTVYSPSGTLLRTIVDGVQDPQSIVLDRRDDVFVANTALGAGRTVTVYAPGKTTLVQTITDGIKFPQSLAIDSTGNLYVANNGNDTATVYAPKTRKLVRTISKKVGAPWALALDSNDNLYLGSFGSKDKVGVYPPGHAVPARTIAAFALSLGFGPP